MVSKTTKTISRQGPPKRPNTNMDRHGQDKTKVSVQHQPYGQAFKNASLKSAFIIISPGLAYMVISISLGKVYLILKKVRD